MAPCNLALFCFRRLILLVSSLAPCQRKWNSIVILRLPISIMFPPTDFALPFALRHNFPITCDNQKTVLSPESQPFSEGLPILWVEWFWLYFLSNSWIWVFSGLFWRNTIFYWLSLVDFSSVWLLRYRVGRVSGQWFHMNFGKRFFWLDYFRGIFCWANYSWVVGVVVWAKPCASSYGCWVQKGVLLRNVWRNVGNLSWRGWLPSILPHTSSQIYLLSQRSNPFLKSADETYCRVN